MTHEFKHLLYTASIYQNKGGKVVLASVVALDGSSYRRPGVRMLLLDNGRMVGRVSGGCVEKEIQRQAQHVFQSNRPVMMSYDGRYRLGCEGIIYVLIEPFFPSKVLLLQLEYCFKQRLPFSIASHYVKQDGEYEGLGSKVIIEKKHYSLSGSEAKTLASDTAVFRQTMPPCFKLVIYGAEHDAVTLCRTASNLGWEVTIIASPDESKTIDFFPGATHFLTLPPEDIPINDIDHQTAVVLMSHSFSKDLKALIAFQKSRPIYFGVLGPHDRKRRLLDAFLDYHPEADFSFFETIRGPAGLNIGAESASEIAISIVSEILSCIRDQHPMALQDKAGRIHD